MLILLDNEERLLYEIFGNIAFLGDMKLIQLFFGSEELWRIGKSFVPPEVYDYPQLIILVSETAGDPSYWMLINGILGASDCNRKEMMKFLISKMEDITAYNNALFQAAVITGGKTLVRMLLCEDKIIDSDNFDAWIETALGHAITCHHDDIHQILERFKASTAAAA